MYKYFMKDTSTNLEQEIEDLNLRIRYMEKMKFYNRQHNDFVDDLQKMEDDYKKDLEILEEMLRRREKQDFT